MQVSVDSLGINSTVTGSIKIGRRVMGLPKGEWQLVVKEAGSGGTDTRAPEIVKLSFQQVEGSRITRFLSITASKFSSNRLWFAEPCKTKGDSYWLEDRTLGMNNQFCLRVSFTSGFVVGAKGNGYEAWAHDVRARNLSFSPEMVGISGTRYTRSDYLYVLLSFDPSVAGIGPSKNPARKFNDWLPDSLDSHPAQRTFYDSLVAWAPQFAGAIEKMFDGDERLQAQDFGEPSFPAKP